ncbi:membrane protein [Bacillus pumilus]|nr:membrane protein [Bacillus pumilus]
MKGSRVEFIDSLRGFSLLGILIVNMLNFQYDYDFEKMFDSSFWGQEFGVYATEILFQGSFYPIFSFLFGYSFIKLIESTKAKGLNTNAIVVRRGFGLIVLGMLHYIFIWNGDILLYYGACTFFLMMFLRSRIKTMLIWSGVLGALSLVVVPYMMNLVYGNDELLTDVYAKGAYGDILLSRITVEDDMMIVTIILAIVTIMFMPILGFLFGTMMVGPFTLLGMVIGKRGHLTEEDRGMAYRKGWVWVIVVGLALKCATFIDAPWSELVMILGGYVLAIGYIQAFIVFYYSKAAEGLKRLLAGLGRLSLSNYLAQSIICTTIFYSYGLGLFGQLGSMFGLLLAVGLYTAQLFISYLYLKKWRRGPVEWLMGKWVYWK